MLEALRNVIVVGLEMCVHTHGDMYKTCVTRVMKRFFETEDGCKWDFHGYRYPRDTWSSYRIVPLTPELEEKIITREKRKYLARINWLDQVLGDVKYKLPDEDINHIYAWVKFLKNK